MKNTPYLILGLANKCLDIKGGNLENLSEIILYEAHGGRNQLWLLTEDGHIVSSLNPNKCLDIFQAKRENGTKVVLYDKHGGDNQKWVLTKEGYISNKLDPNKCLTVKDGNWENGSMIVIWDKNDESHQKWRISYEKPEKLNTHFIIGINNKGIDIAGGISKNYSKLIINDISGSQSQKFYRTEDGIIRSSLDKNMCLDIRYAENKNGTPVILHKIDDGNHKKWDLTKEGYLESRMDRNMCLSSQNGDNGAMLIIEKKANKPNQKWKFSNAIPEKPMSSEIKAKLLNHKENLKSIGIESLSQIYENKSRINFSGNTKITDSNTYKVNPNYLIGGIINYAANSIIELDPEQNFVIFANEINFGNNVKFIWNKKTRVKPSKSSNGPNGESRSQIGVTDRYANGETGGHGAPGADGEKGAYGENAPKIEIWALKVTGTINADLKGQDGGEGGDGGNGGNGGTGGKGSQSYTKITTCIRGPGNGGDGGNGGRGGTGGPGGNGGNGGTFSLFTLPAYINTSINADVRGGNGGNGGRGGTAGSGGQGGGVGVMGEICKLSNKDKKEGKKGSNGNNGNTGNTGNTGLQFPNAVSKETISAAEFTEELLKPHIQPVTPDPLTYSQSLEIPGENFTPISDDIYIGGNLIPRPYLLESSNKFIINYPIPIAGGQQEVDIRRQNGTSANPKGGVKILPYINPVHEDELVVPGEEFELTGYGFSAGCIVNYNNIPITPTLIEPNRIKFIIDESQVPKWASTPVGRKMPTFVRASIGETSNKVNLVEDVFIMLAFGDSHVWGAGLQHHEKFVTKTAEYIREHKTKKSVYLKSFAHQGAIIGLDDAPIGPNGEFHLNEDDDLVHDDINEYRTDAWSSGEVPNDYPIIPDQIKNAITFLSNFNLTPNEVDFIICDGGSNDVGTVTMMSPVGSLFDGENMESRMETIRQRAHRYCYRLFKMHVLENLFDTFTEAKICAVGYYPPISKESDGVSAKAAQLITGWFTNLSKGKKKFWKILEGIFKGITLPGWILSISQVEKMQVFGELWGSEINKNLLQAVNEVIIEKNTDRIFFVAPYFSSQNAMYGNDPWIFSLLLNPLPSATDSVRDDRAALCEHYYTEAGKQLFCKVSSTGHLNSVGANAYFEEIKNKVLNNVSLRIASRVVIASPEKEQYVQYSINSVFDKEVSINKDEEVLLDLSNIISKNPDYFFSVQLSDKNYKAVGEENMDWLKVEQLDVYGGMTSFNLRVFNQSFQKFNIDSGKYYRVKIAVGNPWIDEVKLLHESNQTTSDPVKGS